MADRPLYTNEAATKEAEVISLNLADAAATPSPIESKVRLFTDALVPTVNTVKADLEAAEAAFTGYPSGGYTIEEMNGPLAAPGGGKVIYSPTIPVAFVSGTAATIGGYWLEDSDGDVREVFIYDPPRQLAVVTDGWPITVSLGYGRNSA